VNPDKTALEKPSPRSHGDTEKAVSASVKPVVKPVSAKAATKKPAHHGGTETRRKQNKEKSNH
jgi:hypothetical protein